MMIPLENVSDEGMRIAIEFRNLDKQAIKGGYFINSSGWHTLEVPKMLKRTTGAWYVGFV
jgi:hypothetical protein